jgi:hypothetical protein
MSPMILHLGGTNDLFGYQANLLGGWVMADEA